MKQKPRFAPGQVKVWLFPTISAQELDLFATKYRLDNGRKSRPYWKNGSPRFLPRAVFGILEVPFGREGDYLRRLEKDWLVNRVERVPLQTNR